MPAVTWLGDADGSVDEITMYGHTFVRGKATNVPDDDPYLGKLKAATGAFHTGSGKADVVDEEDSDAVATLKEDLDYRNVKYRANASEESLRKLLAEDDAEKAKAAQAARN